MGVAQFDVHAKAQGADSLLIIQILGVDWSLTSPLGFLSSSVMLPPKRLQQLLTQAVQLQVERCPFHYMEQDISEYSLLNDHICTRFVPSTLVLAHVGDCVSDCSVGVVCSVAILLCIASCMAGVTCSDTAMGVS